MRYNREYVPHHEKKKPVYDLPLNLESVEAAFSNCVDFAHREITLAEGGRGTVCWISGEVQADILYTMRRRAAKSPWWISRKAT